ncbi:MAG: HEAT repeat domain-containing protein [Myxococcaceae bacterium]|nr:HEAT repeat domain-containing protein [Myxococcaceae bacterium]
MKTSSIIVVVGALGAIGLSLLLLQDGDEGLTPPSGPTPAQGSAQGLTPSSGSTPRATGSSGPSGSSAMPQGSDGRPSATSPDPQSPTSPRAPMPQAVAAPPSAGGAMGPEADRVAAAAAGSSASAGKGGDPRVVEALNTARQHPRKEERLSALRWLGENAGPEQFDALQQIQIKDPSPEVRTAAELAVNTMRERHTNSEWPGVPKDARPQDYMRNVPPPP